MSARYFEPASQWLMILGIVILCQPWITDIRAYGVTVSLIGLAGFNVFSKIRPLERQAAPGGHG